MAEDDAVRWWLSQLTGFSAQDFIDATADIRSWGIPRLTSLLCCRPSGDELVAGALLVQDMEALENAGVEREVLLRRLRRDHDVWPTWAEIHAASVIAHVVGPGCSVDLNIPGQSGRNADFGFHSPSTGGTFHVEVKALGLSYDEQQFCKRCAPLLRRIQPRRGIAILQHKAIDGALPAPTGMQIHDMEEGAAKWWRLPPGKLRSLSASVSVAHDTVDDYVRRLSLRIQESLNQLPLAKDGWIAFHWTNGAPGWALKRAIEDADLPEHVQGVMFVGSAIFLDGALRNFLIQIPKDPIAGGAVVMDLDDRMSSRQQRAMVKAFEQSGSVRVTVLRVPTCNGLREIIARDGSTGFWPFVLILGSDPAAILPRRRVWPFRLRSGPVWTNPRA